LGGLTVNIFATLHIQSCIFDYYLTYFLLFNFSGGQLREIGTRLNLPSPGIYILTRDGLQNVVARCGHSLETSKFVCIFQVVENLY
jgi:hypothetical protein